LPGDEAAHERVAEPELQEDFYLSRPIQSADRDHRDRLRPTAGQLGGRRPEQDPVDKYAEFHSGSAVFSVDCDPQATALCRSLVSDRVWIHAGDSTAWLKS